MYMNLKAKMAIHNVSIEEIAKWLNIHRNTVAYKINEGSFSVEEAFSVKERFFKDCDTLFLFSKINSQKLKAE